MGDDLIQKTKNWITESSEAIREAGGNPDNFISMIPDSLFVHLVRNDLVLTYRKKRV